MIKSWLISTTESVFEHIYSKVGLPGDFYVYLGEALVDYELQISFLSRFDSAAQNGVTLEKDTIEIADMFIAESRIEEYHEEEDIKDLLTNILDFLIIGIIGTLEESVREVNPTLGLEHTTERSR